MLCAVKIDRHLGEQQLLEMAVFLYAGRFDAYAHSINAFAQRWSTPYATVTFQARQVSDLPGLKGLYVLRSAAI